MSYNNPNVEVFVPDGKKSPDCSNRTTYLTIAAHPDDIELMSSHEIIKCINDSVKWFGGVVLTDGTGSARSGMYSQYDDQQMKSIRAKEQKKAAFLGEYSIQYLMNYTSKQVKEENNGLIEDLQNIILSTSPKIVYTHSIFDRHETHRATAIKVIQAIRSLPEKYKPQKIYGCEVWGSLDWVPNEYKMVFKYNNHENLLTSLVNLYDSQINGGKEYGEAIMGRRKANAVFHEMQAIENNILSSFAIDLTELICNSNMNILEYANIYIDRFKEEMLNQIKKMV